MLRRAGPQDAGYVQQLWSLPAHADFIMAPTEGQVEAAIADGMVFLWEVNGLPIGYACLTEWHPHVMGLLSVVVTQPGIGAHLLRAVMAEVFGPMKAHRLGLDVTCDNHRALRLYQALGFRHEGVMRECWQRPKGDFVDCAFMSILAREYQT